MEPKSPTSVKIKSPEPKLLEPAKKNSFRAGTKVPTLDMKLPQEEPQSPPKQVSFRAKLTKVNLKANENQPTDEPKSPTAEPKSPTAKPKSAERDLGYKQASFLKKSPATAIRTTLLLRHKSGTGTSDTDKQPLTAREAALQLELERAQRRVLDYETRITGLEDAADAAALERISAMGADTFREVKFKEMEVEIKSLKQYEFLYSSTEGEVQFLRDEVMALRKDKDAACVIFESTLRPAAYCFRQWTRWVANSKRQRRDNTAQAIFEVVCNAVPAVGSDAALLECVLEAVVVQKQNTLALRWEETKRYNSQCVDVAHAIKKAWTGEASAEMWKEQSEHLQLRVDILEIDVLTTDEEMNEMRAKIESLKKEVKDGVTIRDMKAMAIRELERQSSDIAAARASEAEGAAAMVEETNNLRRSVSSLQESVKKNRSLEVQIAAEHAHDKERLASLLVTNQTLDADVKRLRKQAEEDAAKQAELEDLVLSLEADVTSAQEKIRKLEADLDGRKIESGVYMARVASLEEALETDTRKTQRALGMVEAMKTKETELMAALEAKTLSQKESFQGIEMVNSFSGAGNVETELLAALERVRGLEAETKSVNEINDALFSQLHDTKQTMESLRGKTETMETKLRSELNQTKQALETKLLTALERVRELEAQSKTSNERNETASQQNEALLTQLHKTKQAVESFRRKTETVETELLSALERVRELESSKDAETRQHETLVSELAEAKHTLRSLSYNHTEIQENIQKQKDTATSELSHTKRQLAEMLLQQDFRLTSYANHVATLDQQVFDIGHSKSSEALRREFARALAVVQTESDECRVALLAASTQRDAFRAELNDIKRCDLMEANRALQAQLRQAREYNSSAEQPRGNDEGAMEALRAQAHALECDRDVLQARYGLLQARCRSHEQDIEALTQRLVAAQPEDACEALGRVPNQAQLLLARCRSHEHDIETQRIWASQRATPQSMPATPTLGPGPNQAHHMPHQVRATTPWK